MPSSLDTPTLLRVIKAAAIFISAASSGTLLTISAFGVPNFLAIPSNLMLQQWEHTYNQGKKFMPPIAGTAALGYFYLAHRFGGLSATTGPARAFALAGGLCISIVPYTTALMKPTNNALLKKREESKGLTLGMAGVEDLGAKQLVGRWGMMNLGRSALLGSAAFIALFVSL